MATANVTDETGVANLALQRIGRAIIADIDSGTDKVSTAVDRMFSDTRDEVASMLPWSSLMTRTAINTSDASGESGFTYKQTLADTVLRVVDLTGNDGSENNDWRREGTTLFFNLATGYIRHIQRTTSVTIWDALYLSCLEARLASKLAVYLSSDQNLALAMQQEYVSLLSTAVLIKAVEEHENNERVLAQMDARLAQYFMAISGGGRRTTE